MHKRDRLARAIAVTAVLGLGFAWLVQSRVAAQDDARGCTAPVSWGDLKSGAAVTPTAVALTFEDKSGTIRVARGETKGTCRLLLTVTRE